MTPQKKARLAPRLEALYRRQPADRWVQEDPIEIPRRYADPKEIEVAGLLASALAYGRVALFKAAVEKILALADGAPYRYLAAFDPHRERPRFQGIYYRLNGTEDLFCLVYLMSRVIQQYGSIGALFLSLYREEEEDIGPTLARFVAALYAFDTRPIYGKRLLPDGLRQLLSSPKDGSACKRLNLFLRWMIRRNDGIDFGLWKEIPPEKLIVPLDTHLIRISHYLGLTSRKSPDWKMAKELTESLKAFDSSDPLKYDFPLCHLGISGACPPDRNEEKCLACPLLDACGRGSRLIRSRIRRQALQSTSLGCKPY